MGWSDNETSMFAKRMSQMRDNRGLERVAKIPYKKHTR